MLISCWFCKPSRSQNHHGPYPPSDISACPLSSPSLFFSLFPNGNTSRPSPAAALQSHCPSVLQCTRYTAIRCSWTLLSKLRKVCESQVLIWHAVPAPGTCYSNKSNEWRPHCNHGTWLINTQRGHSLYRTSKGNDQKTFH